MTDVYDGNLWKEWDDYLKVTGNLLLMLNVDWFRSYTPYMQCWGDLPGNSEFTT